jgi:hypothetical protein
LAAKASAISRATGLGDPLRLQNVVVGVEAEGAVDLLGLSAVGQTRLHVEQLEQLGEQHLEVVPTLARVGGHLQLEEASLERRDIVVEPAQRLGLGLARLPLGAQPFLLL